MDALSGAPHPLRRHKAGADHMQWTINDLFPRFILRDQNGYAMAMAINVALKAMADAAENALSRLSDIDQMPEWLLDETAWEMNLLYDYKADITQKRNWIRNASQYYAHLGTPQAIINILDGYFDAVSLDEWYEYNGEPYHFRVRVDGNLTEKTNEWVHKAIEACKNVRSVLDDVSMYTKIRLDTVSGAAMCVMQKVTIADAENGG